MAKPLQLGYVGEVDGDLVELLITEILTQIEGITPTGPYVECGVDEYFYTLSNGSVGINLNSHGKDHVLRIAAEQIKSPLVDNRKCFYELGHTRTEFEQNLFKRLQSRPRYRVTQAKYKVSHGADSIRALNNTITRLELSIDDDQKRLAAMKEQRDRLLKPC